MTSSYEIRLHGVGGQGVAATADLMGLAAVKDARSSHSFPFFGTEIRGGAVTAFTRISSQPIHTRSFIRQPDMIVVFADYLVTLEMIKDMREDTVLLVNITNSDAPLPPIPCGRLVKIEADRIARTVPGSRISNGAILGAICAVSRQFSLESIESAVREKFSLEVAEPIIKTAHLGYQAIQESEVQHDASLV